MRVLLLDGYMDEPACLGVPPYISPNIRLAYGACTSAGADVRYSTVDQLREGRVDLAWAQLLAVIRRISVPGKYLRGMPASDRELKTVCSSFKGKTIVDLGEGGEKSPASLRDSFDVLVRGDIDAGLFDLLTTGSFSDRAREYLEWNSWLARGAQVCTLHPDHGGPLIAEMQMYRGCVRYISGGCRFCTEPLLGRVEFREEQDIVSEARALADAGVKHLRLGAQSCVYCYKSEDTGRSETPEPNVSAVTRVLKGIRSTMNPRVFHLDNANPAVIAAHPEKSRRITEAIVENCTSGNVLAFGLESADPKVAKANNLNTTADETLEAIRLVNSVGGRRGPSGMPNVLPGINFVCGLEGETKETYRHNLEFLHRVLSEGLSLRRVNIRQVIPSRNDHPGVRHKKEFSEFKRAVREDIDQPMLERILPDRTVLREVYAELREGGRTFGRQVGSYPLLVGIPYAIEIGARVDVAVTGRNPRSVTGIVYPTDVNTATMSMLQAVPGIGRKRAMAIIRGRPFTKAEDVWAMFDEPTSQESARFHLAVGEQ